MTSITVRTITDDEVGAFTDAMNLGFNSHSEADEAEVRRSGLEMDRTFVAVDDERFIGTTRTFSTPLTVPGGASVPVGALTNVAVVPTHRRRGALNAMMRAQLDDSVTRGEVASILIASEAPIYGRYGYGPATWVTSLRLQRARARLANRPAGIDAVRMVDREELRAVVPAIYERHRGQTPGAIERTARNWDLRLGVIQVEGSDRWKTQFHAVHEGADGPDGWVSYRIEGKWDHRFPDNIVNVDDLVALDDDAYAALWGHVLSLDWVTTIIAEDRPPSEPLPWLLADGRQVDVVHLSDLMWARLLDVPVTLAARAYSGTDRLVIDVADHQGYAGGRFALDASPGGATCAPTTDAPDLSITVADLSAAWLGGTPLTQPAGAGRVTEHTPGAVRRFDTLFTWHPAPWCNTWF